MISNKITNKQMAVAIVAIQLVLFVILMIYPNIVVALIAAFSFTIAAIVWRFGFIIKPIITRSANITEIFGNYEIPPSQEVVVMKNDNRYYATAYLLVRFTQSSTEKTAEQIALTRQSYERALSSLNYVYKISNMVCPVDLSHFVDKIRERRSIAESRISELQSLPPSSVTGSDITRLKREVESYGNQLSKILEGERPMMVINYAMTSACSYSREEAIEKAKQHAAELKTVIASTLDTEVLLLSGDDMKRCFEWEYMLPDKESTDDDMY